MLVNSSYKYFKPSIYRYFRVRSRHRADRA
jgi:hypothetical protein